MLSVLSIAQCGPVHDHAARAPRTSPIPQTPITGGAHSRQIAHRSYHLNGPRAERSYLDRPLSCGPEASDTDVRIAASLGAANQPLAPDTGASATDTNRVAGAKHQRTRDAIERSFSLSNVRCCILDEPEQPDLECGIIMPPPPGEYMPQVLRSDGPYRRSPIEEGIFGPTGERVPFPWEDVGGITTAMGQCCLASYMSAPSLPDALPCDRLLSQAMMMSSADESMGEDTTGVRAWKDFCFRHDVSPTMWLDPNAPLSQKLKVELFCMRFLCSIVEERGIAVDTASGYFGHVQGWAAKRTGIKLCGGLKLSRLPAMLKGLKRIVGQPAKKIRRGIAAQKLSKAMDMLLDPNDPLHANIRAAIAVAFQGLLRSAEYCSNKRASKEKLLKTLPTRSDLKALDDTKMVMMMCPCKNMAHLGGKTVPLVIGAGGTIIDAVKEVTNLLNVDKVPKALDADTPLFRDPRTGMPLTYETMLDIIKKLMIAVGEDPDEFGTHSLRIGGATALYAQGATPMVIRTMGRWSSDCYRLYVRACYEASLQWTSKAGSAHVTDVVPDFDEVDDY